MAKMNRKPTPAGNKAKKARKAERPRKYDWTTMNSKQGRVKRQPTVDGIPVDQFIEENADPIWLHQNEMWEMIPVEHAVIDLRSSAESCAIDAGDELPF